MVDLQTVGVLITASSVTVAAIYYMITLRISQKNMKTTLETRQAQLFMHFASQMTSDSFVEHALNVGFSDWRNLKEFQDWYEKPGTKNQASWGIMMNFFENAGVLVRRDLLDIDMVATGFVGMTRRFWERMRPVIIEQRVSWGMPRLASEFEFLYNRLMRYMDEHPEFKT